MRLVLMFCATAVLGVGSTQSGAAQVASDSTKIKDFSWSVLPIIFSSPETDWAFGVLPQAVFHLPRTERDSRVFVAAYYTLNKQYTVATVGSLWFNEDRDNTDFALETKYWPTDFYGLSAKNADVEGISYVERATSAEFAGSHAVGSRFRLGVGARILKMKVIPEDESGGIGSVSGSEGGRVIGLGPTFGIDSRDHVFFPTRGWFINVSTFVGGYAFGGDYDFLNVRADIRRYHRISDAHVVGAQALLDFNSAGVPFWTMSGVGTVIRGYSEMQFLDRHLAAFQLEYRVVPVVWRIGLTAFAGVGVVGNAIDKLAEGPIRWAGGLGLRFLFMRESKISLRWDFGFGSASSASYIDMGEAF